MKQAKVLCGLLLIGALALGGCGSSGNNESQPGATVAIPEDCFPKTEDNAPGNFDRYSFRKETSDGSFVGFKNGKGEVVIEPVFGFAYEFGKGGISAAVIRSSANIPNNRAVFIDVSGKELAQALMFDNGPDYFQNGYARIVNEAGRLGFIDRTGKITITPRFVDAQAFCDGKALVADGASEWQIDKTGKRVSDKAPYVAEPEDLD